MSAIDNAFLSLSNFRLWLNNQGGTSLLLSDFPELISLRWTYFRDNWGYLQSTLVKSIPSYVFPNLLQANIDALTNFINLQAASTNQNINPFSNSSVFTTYYAVFDSILLSNIALTQQEQAIVNNKLTVIKNYTKTDFVNILDSLTAARDYLADITGTSDPTYNAVFQRNSAAPMRSITLTDISQMYYIQQSIDGVNAVLANIYNLPTVTLDPFALAKANTNNPNYFIQQNISGYLVRMQYGDSLENLATRYLGTPDRWIEIAIANGLKPPYIDEVGQTIPLVANGGGSYINIAGTDAFGNSNYNKLYVNQVVFLYSNSMPMPVQYTIVAIKQIPISGELVIELKGDLNLSVYTVAENAVLQVFALDTINSKFFIMIPTTNALPDSVKTDTPWFLSTSSADAKLSKVDLLVDANGDLVFGNDEDLQLSYGVANAVQAMKLKIVTEQGSVPRHPTYGLASVVGVATNKRGQAQSILTSSILSSVAADSRFAGVQNISVTNLTTGSGFLINLVVKLAGSGTAIPLTFQVNL